jgi:hypothetical protein
MSDTYKRNFSGNLAQCGCRWVREAVGDVLKQCPIHHAATVASVMRFEAERRVCACGACK